MKKIRILTIGHSYVLAINRSFLREMAKHDDFDITVAAPFFVQGSLRPIECENEPIDSRLRLVKLDCYITRRIHIMFYNNSQLKKLLQENFDLVYIWEEPYVLSCYQISRLIPESTPFCFYTNQNIKKKYFFPFSYFEKYNFSHAKKWIACGELVKKVMLAKGFSNDKSKIIPFAVDGNKFKQASDLEKEKYISKHNLKTPLFIYMGRLIPEKGIPLLLDVIKKLNLERDWSFMFIGSGPMKDEIHTWIRENQLEDRVRLSFFQHHEIPDIINKGDILLCPSQTSKNWREQFGRMIVEGFASGLIVIGSDSGEIPYVVGDAGVILPENDIDIWCKTISDIIQNIKPYENYKALGVLRSQKFSAERVGEIFSDLFKEMLGD